MELQEFFANNRVFTHAQAIDFLRTEYSTNRRTQEALLRYHLNQGHLCRIRRGLYAVVPLESNAKDYPVDPFLIASKLATDSVLAYHTALQFYGKAYTVFNHYIVLSASSLRPTTFEPFHFKSVPFPKALRSAGQEFFATKIIDRQGVDVRIAQLERTLVDVFDRPHLSGGWEEIWRSLELIEYFDLDLILEYVDLLDNATTASKVGFFLEQHAEALWVEQRHLSFLRKRRPKQPHYLVRGKNGKLISQWNLVVPENVLQRHWEDVL